MNAITQHCHSEMSLSTFEHDFIDYQIYISNLTISDRTQ